MASIQKRPDGRWRARYRDASGKEHAKHFQLKRDAQAWLDEVAAMRKTGVYVDPGAGRITFNQWFHAWAGMQVWAAGTRTAADRAVAGIPFGEMPLGRIQPSDVQQWVAGMHEAGLAASTVQTRYNYVHMCLRAAVGERIVRDPSKLATRSSPGGVRLPKTSRSSTMKIPTVEQMRLLHDSARFYFRPFVAVCAFAGLRLGEAAGLRVSDLDLDGAAGHGVALHVQRQVQGQTNEQVKVVPPKYQSDRWVPIPVELADMLTAHVRQLGTLGDEGYLFTPDGQNLYHRNSAGHLWRDAATRADVAGFTLHSCRHFFASSLIASGCDVVTVQKALGHSTPTITLNTYSHLWPNAHERTRSATAAVMSDVLNTADNLRTIADK